VALTRSSRTGVSTTRSETSAPGALRPHSMQLVAPGAAAELGVGLLVLDQLLWWPHGQGRRYEFTLAAGRRIGQPDPDFDDHGAVRTTGGWRLGRLCGGSGSSTCSTSATTGRICPPLRPTPPSGRGAGDCAGVPAAVRRLATSQTSAGAARTATTARARCRRTLPQRPAPAGRGGFRQATEVAPEAQPWQIADEAELGDSGRRAQAVLGKATNECRGRFRRHVDTPIPPRWCSWTGPPSYWRSSSSTGSTGSGRSHGVRPAARPGAYCRVVGSGDESWSGCGTFVRATRARA
jgi:hypothetical protein